MSPTRKQLYDLANNFYTQATIELIDQDHTFKLYRIKYKGTKYELCICHRKSNYTGTATKFHYRNKSEKLALNLCWKKIVEPSLD